jgi:hypothetical protein
MPSVDDMGSANSPFSAFVLDPAADNPGLCGAEPFRLQDGKIVCPKPVVYPAIFNVNDAVVFYAVFDKLLEPVCVKVAWTNMNDDGSVFAVDELSEKCTKGSSVQQESLFVTYHPYRGTWTAGYQIRRAADPLGYTTLVWRSFTVVAAGGSNSDGGVVSMTDGGTGTLPATDMASPGPVTSATPKTAFYDFTTTVATPVRTLTCTDPVVPKPAPQVGVQCNSQTSYFSYTGDTVYGAIKIDVSPNVTYQVTSEPIFNGAAYGMYANQGDSASSGPTGKTVYHVFSFKPSVVPITSGGKLDFRLYIDITPSGGAKTRYWFGDVIVTLW